MATLHVSNENGSFACIKGAPERLIALCDRQRAGDGTEPIEPGRWHERIEVLGSQGQRVLAIAVKTMPAGTQRLVFDDFERGADLLGLVGLIDPPREEAIAAVSECRAAGIRPIMITGDHAATAAAIATQLGLGERPAVVTGQALEGLDGEQLLRLVADTAVFARTSPEHKLRLVEAMQAGGAVVAMTGDGVNDAPALKRADVGVAMGGKGTEAAKEAAEMVLADDNFASIVAAVREGRTVYDNLKKVIGWTLPTNGGEAFAIIAAILLGLTLPVTAVQILWVNMVTAVTLGLPLAFEPTEPGAMLRPPRSPREPLLTSELLWKIVFVSALFAAGVFGAFYWALDRGLALETARTLAVNTLVAMEVAFLFNVRFVHGTSLSWRGALGTPPVLVSLGSVTLAQLAFTYLPLLQTAFHTRALGPVEIAVALAIGAALFFIVELEKRIRRRGRWRGSHST
jgi:magnesium-transporting ATPase (P-type)